MTNIYKKLFNINYNNKTFTIFLDKYGRKTFLELSTEGKYKYPNIDEFIYLHKIYNERNPFVFYYGIGDKLPAYKPKKFTFKEGVLDLTKVISVVLAGVISYNSLVSFELNKNKENDVLEVKPTYIDNYLDNADALDPYIGSDIISEEDLIAAINNNPNLDDIYKERAILLAQHIKKEHPNTDNRIFYDNMKTLKIFSLEDNNENQHKCGIYNSYINAIKIKNKNTVEDTSNKDQYSFENEIILHELAHAYHCWTSKNQDQKYVYRTNTIGYSLDEAMTNKVIEGLFNFTTRTYIREGELLDYLLTFVNYNYYDYEQGGIDKLYNMLKEKYPEVDIEYIFNVSDTMHITYFEQGNDIKIQDNSEYLDCLFDLCIHNIDFNNPYGSLMNFLKLIDYNDYLDIATNYINKYNEILKIYGYENNVLGQDELLNKLKEIEELNNFDHFLNNITIDSNTTGPQIYQPLKEYLKTVNTTSDNFYQILKKYNDFLTTQGFSKENIISEQEYLNKSQKYQNLSISGYAITKDGNVYFTVNIPEKDRVYNSETRLPILDTDGKVTLLDINNVNQTSNIGGIQSIFNYYLLTNPLSDLSWYNYSFFEKEYDISPYDYNEVDISLNGNVITHNYIDNLMVTIGVNADGTNSYKLTSRDGKVLYQTGNPVIKIPFLFSDYLKIDGYKQTVELSSVFSKDYLKKFVLNDSRTDIENKQYIYYDELNDKIEFKQRPTIILNNDPDNEILFNNIFVAGEENKDNNLMDVYLTINNSRYYLFSKNSSEPLKTSTLYDVLNYYGLYDETNFSNRYSTNELIDLFTNYLNETLNIDNNLEYDVDYSHKR